MSLERPELPLEADSPEKLVAHVTNNPSDWLMYLRYINGYAAVLKKKKIFLASLNSIMTLYFSFFDQLLPSRKGLSNTRKPSIKKYRFASKKITQLEIEKVRLLDAVIPAV
jgi:hypothetical protein